MKKKDEKLLLYKIKNGDFNKIKDKINYNVYDKRVSFKDFLFSKRSLKYVCPLLSVCLFLSLSPLLFREVKNNSNAEISQVNSMNTSYNTSLCSTNNMMFIATIEVYGEILIKEDVKMFYTDESYGYYNELNQGSEFLYSGYYDISNLNNYDELNVYDKCVASIVTDSDVSYYKYKDIYEIRVLD